MLLGIWQYYKEAKVIWRRLHRMLHKHTAALESIASVILGICWWSQNSKVGHVSHPTTP